MPVRTGFFGIASLFPLSPRVYTRTPGDCGRSWKATGNTNGSRLHHLQDGRRGMLPCPERPYINWRKNLHVAVTRATRVMQQDWSAAVRRVGEAEADKAVGMWRQESGQSGCREQLSSIAAFRPIGRLACPSRARIGWELSRLTKVHHRCTHELPPGDEDDLVGMRNEVNFAAKAEMSSSLGRGIGKPVVGTGAPRGGQNGLLRKWQSSAMLNLRLLICPIAGVGALISYQAQE
ncbi:unnamed protein product [Protopolystoma xenopodis]|uniref:Uncharacterized protein n=1 Tax=Protopolystoma xenopodis TaxID=117903 RepID=A0A448WLR5_9PLAT|nr:unnamed protein product [Protopolystoma xenopodis]